ncbi:MAG: hypothetical protein LBO79_00175 [Zoogloeaceae bacterium]|nr:hypothetical protein [Zoogloeaceae bacterium]
MLYASSRDYDGRFGHFVFRKHCYGRIRFWVRNLVRREGCSFFLQKADGRFYPDFLCQLPEAKGQAGAVLAVEYKGADRWGNAEDDRLIGGLWASLSDGRCHFVMVTEKQRQGGGLRRGCFEAGLL